MHATIRPSVIRPLVICAVAALIHGQAIGSAWAQNAPEAHPAPPGVGPGSASGPGWGAEEEQAPAQAGAAAEEGQPALFVTSVEVLHATAGEGMNIVRVTGLAASDGWSDPQLVPTYAGKPADNVLDLQLIATPPEASEHAGGLVPISAVFEIEGNAPLAGVRVRGADNAVTVRNVPGSMQAAVRVNDCANCIGKKFAAAGSAATGQQDVVREEDLPKPLRVIRAADGIHSIDRDPNRLTLILDENNTILEAFWE